MAQRHAMHSLLGRFHLMLSFSTGPHPRFLTICRPRPLGSMYPSPELIVSMSERLSTAKSRTSCLPPVLQDSLRESKLEEPASLTFWRLRAPVSKLLPASDGDSSPTSVMTLLSWMFFWQSRKEAL